MSVSIDFTARDREVTAAFKRIDDGLNRLTRSSSTLNRNMLALNRASDYSKLSKSMDTAAKSTATFNNKILDTIGGLKAAAIAAAAFAGAFAYVNKVVNSGDAMTMIDNRISIVVGRTAKLAVVRKQLSEIAANTKSTLSDSADLFGSLGLTLKDKYTTDKLLSLVETVQNASKIGAQSPESTSAALVQFGQAMSGNWHGSGQELQSIAEQAPMILVAIAKGMKMSTTEVRKLAAEGKLTTDAVTNALLSQREDLAKQAANQTPTVAAGWMLAKDALMQYHGELNRALGINQYIGKALLGIANYFRAHAKTIGKTVDDFINPWARSIHKIVVYASELWPQVEAIFINFKNGVIAIFTELWDVLVGHSIWPDTVDQIAEYTKTLWPKVKAYLVEFRNNVVNMFSNLQSWLGSIDYFKLALITITGMATVFRGMRAYANFGTKGGLLSALLFGAGVVSFATQLSSIDVIKQSITNLVDKIKSYSKDGKSIDLGAFFSATLPLKAIGTALSIAKAKLIESFKDTSSFLSVQFGSLKKKVLEFYKAVVTSDFGSIANPLTSIYDYAVNTFDIKQAVFILSTLLMAVFNASVRGVVKQSFKLGFGLLLLTAFNVEEVNSIVGWYLQAGFYSIYNMLVGSAKSLSSNALGDVIAQLYIPSTGATERLIPKISRAIGNALTTAGVALGSVLFSSVFSSLPEAQIKAMTANWAGTIGTALGFGAMYAFNGTFRSGIKYMIGFLTGTADNVLAGALLSPKLRTAFYKRLFTSFGSLFVGWNLGEVLADSLKLGKGSLLYTATELATAFGTAFITDAAYAMMTGEGLSKKVKDARKKPGVTVNGRKMSKAQPAEVGPGFLSSAFGLVTSAAIGFAISQSVIDPIIEQLTGGPLSQSMKIASAVITMLGTSMAMGMSLPLPQGMKSKTKNLSAVFVKTMENMIADAFPTKVKGVQRVAIGGLGAAIGMWIGGQMVEGVGLSSNQELAVKGVSTVAGTMIGLLASQFSEAGVGWIQNRDWTTIKQKITKSLLAKLFGGKAGTRGAVIGAAIAVKPVVDWVTESHQDWSAAQQVGAIIGAELAVAVGSGLAASMTTGLTKYMAAKTITVFGPAFTAMAESIRGNKVAYAAILSVAVMEVMSIALNGQGMVEKLVPDTQKMAGMFVDALTSALVVGLGAIAIGASIPLALGLGLLAAIGLGIARFLGPEKMAEIGHRVLDAIEAGIEAVVGAGKWIILLYTDPQMARDQGAEFIKNFMEGVKSIGSELSDWLKQQMGFPTGNLDKDLNSVAVAKDSIATADTPLKLALAVDALSKANENLGKTIAGKPGALALDGLDFPARVQAMLSREQDKLTANQNYLSAFPVNSLQINALSNEDTGLNPEDLATMAMATVQIADSNKKIGEFQAVLDNLKVNATNIYIMGGGLGGGVLLNVPTPRVDPEANGSTRRAAGGWVFGAGSATSDSIPAMLSNGEFVINAKQSKKFAGVLQMINSGRMGHHKDGLAPEQPGFFQSTMDYLTGGQGTRIEPATDAENKLSDARTKGIRVATAAERHAKWLADRTKENAKKLEESVWELEQALKEASDMNKDYFAQVGVDGAKSMSDSMKSHLKAALSGTETPLQAISGFIDDFTSQIISGFVDSFTNSIFKGLNLDSIFANMFSGNAQMGAGVGTAVAGKVAGAGGGGFLAGALSWLGGLFHLADGGHISGPGTGTSDSIPAMLSNGEFVVNAAATKRWSPLLHSINSGSVPHFAGGGRVGSPPTALMGGGKASGKAEQHFHITVTGDVSAQTRKEIVKMIPDITAGVNMTNREKGNR